jgi:hypothetical protein
MMIILKKERLILISFLINLIKKIKIINNILMLSAALPKIIVTGKIK